MPASNTRLRANKIQRSSAAMKLPRYIAAMRTASSTSTDTRRETPGSFIVTPPSCEAISMVLLLWVMKMNCPPPDIVLIQRRIDFVQQTERRRVQVKNGEHQRHGGQGLLAARQLTDGAVAFAGRARHDRDARGIRLLAGQFEISMAAAEQAREFFLQSGVDAIERILKSRAGFAIDFAHRRLERFQRIGQVLALPIQVLFALGLFLEFADRREIDLT